MTMRPPRTAPGTRPSAVCLHGCPVRTPTPSVVLARSRKRRAGARAASRPETQAATDDAKSTAEDKAWKDYWGNYVRAPVGYKSFLIQDPQIDINGTSANDPERWIKFTPEVGPVGARKPKPYAFKRVLAPPSTLVSVRMPRPLGITFEMDEKGYTRVVELVRNSKAAQQSSVARLGAGPESGAYTAVGDVLRGATATTMDWGGRTKLTGDLSGSQRRVVLFGADGQSWAEVQGALRSGQVADGEVELVLERPGAGSPDADGFRQSDAELELLAATAAARQQATIPGTLNEADSFNYAILASVAAVLLLFLSGFS
mmetsp:Transcript_7227/g.18804  ORF Transcript_7227/g.18804 Transcript_7227/m.18804 type:complete len:315 (+) Transcript_7227:91-1035(+)